MNITVNLFATFRNGRFKQEQRDYPEGMTFRQVVVDVGIAEGEIGMALVNGRHAPLDHPMCAGDSISLFPLMCGG